MLYYIRDDEGALEGFKYDDIVYYYEKNLADDIIGILNQNKEKIATYEYDSWGNILSIKDENKNEITDSNHIAIINPFRYRSYYYDKETNLYYLNSRYYNPKIKRFINADGYVSTGQDINGYNMYAYCNNNPINSFDLDGSLLKWLKNLGAKFINRAIITGKKIYKSLKNNFTFEVGSGNGIHFSNGIIFAKKQKKPAKPAKKKPPRKSKKPTSISASYKSTVIYEGYKNKKYYKRSETTSSISIGPVGYGKTAEKDITDPIKSQLTDFQPNKGFNVTAGDSFSIVSDDSEIFIGYEFGLICYTGGIIRIGWEIDYK